MRSRKSVGGMVGILLLAQAAIALLMRFVLLAPVNAPPGFLANAAGSAMQVRVAMLRWSSPRQTARMSCSRRWRRRLARRGMRRTIPIPLWEELPPSSSTASSGDLR